MRHYIDVVFVDCQDDEVILVKKIEALLELVNQHKEKIVCIICSEDVSTVQVQKGSAK